MNLNKILKKHEMWLNNEIGGECGERANLRGANLKNVDLRGVNLRSILLSYANLSGADLRGVDLKNADLRFTDLSNADLRYADLRYSYLNNANLRSADLRCANLTDTDLRGADLRNIKTDMYTMGYSLACPEEGSFIGYKKADKYLVKLLIPEDAKRSSSTTTKCRCDKAKVLDIENIKTGLKVMEANSNYNSNFIYRVGEIVTVEDFDEDRWNECAPGIHFFMNRENAINY